MEFDLGKVYTHLTADEIKVGSHIAMADGLFNLKDFVNSFETYDPDLVLLKVLPENFEKRFVVHIDGKDRAYEYAYLLDEIPNDKKIEKNIEKLVIIEDDLKKLFKRKAPIIFKKLKEIVKQRLTLEEKSEIEYEFNEYHRLRKVKK